MKILITGGKGFVGRAYNRLLPIVYGSKTQITNVDLKDGIDCRDWFKTHKEKYDLVIHLAAIVGGRATIEGSPMSVAADLAIDSDFFNWVLETEQSEVIYFSSSAAYPIALQSRMSHVKLEENCIDLDFIDTPDLTYGWAKLTGEMLAHFVGLQSETGIHVFRPFSGYGEDQDLDYPFPSFIRRIKDKEDPFEIWGDGKQVRDFIHINDIVYATLKAVELEIDGPINLGWGIPTSFNELATMAFNISGWTPTQVNHLLDKPVGVYYRCSSSVKMNSFYKPKIDLEEGISRSLAYNG